MNRDIHPHEMLAELERQAEPQDELMGRAIEALKDMMADRAAIESLQDRMLEASAARTAFIVELAVTLAEHRTGCTILQLFQTRRPVLRCIKGGLL